MPTLPSHRTIALSCLVLAAAPAAAQVPQALVVNDTLITDRSTAAADAPGYAVTNLSSTSVVANDAGGWAFFARGDYGGGGGDDDYFYLGNPTSAGPTRVLRDERAIAGYNQDQLGVFFDMTDAGTLVYGATDTAGDQAIFRGDNLLVREGTTTIDGLPVTGGLFVVAGSDSGPVTFLAELDGGRTLVQRDADGTFDRLLYPGQPGTQIGTGGEDVNPSNFAVQGTRAAANANGDWLAEVRVGTTTSDNVWICGDGDGNATPLTTAGGGIVREDRPLPPEAGGRAGDSWDTWSFGGAAINDSGLVLLAGRLNGDNASDDVLLYDGEVVLREGDAFAGGTLQGFADATALNGDGDWLTVWDVARPGGGTDTALILNGEPIVVTGERVDLDGATFPGTVNQDILEVIFDDVALTGRRADGTLDVYFTGRTNGSNAIQYADTILFRVTVPEPASAGLLVVVGLVLQRRRR